jgi:hypothetical protein
VSDTVGTVSALDSIRARWPKDQLEYLRLLATTVLALVLVPLALARLILHPAAAAERAIAGAVR